MLVQRTTENRKQRRKQKTRKQKKENKKEKEKDQDNKRTTSGGPASRTLEILFLFLIAIPMQSIRVITTATTTGWPYLTNEMFGKTHTINDPPGGVKTAETGARVKLKQRRKLPINMERTSKKKRKIKKKKTSWKLLKWGLKSLSLVSVFTISTQSLTPSSDSTHKRIYTLAHDKTIVNLPGNAFPIKIATRTRNKGKIRASYKS
jgi:hypothetical protein